MRDLVVDQNPREHSGWTVRFLDHRTGHQESLNGQNWTIEEAFLKLYAKLRPLWETRFSTPDVRRADGSETKYVQYPQEALVEALINLFVHWRQGRKGTAEILIHTNRIVFCNPGASRHSAEQILLAPREIFAPPREPVLAALLRGLVGLQKEANSQDQDRGLVRIRRALVENDVRRPDGGLSVEIRNDPRRDVFCLTIWAYHIQTAASQARFKHDMFVIYGRDGRRWVEEKLVPFLDINMISYTEQELVSSQDLQWLEIERSVRQSHRTLVILTPGFVRDWWRLFEPVLAGGYGRGKDQWRVVPILAHACEVPSRLLTTVSFDLFKGGKSDRLHLAPSLLPYTVETVVVPAGVFWMGSADDDPDARSNELPRHRVLVPDYRISKYPVTNAQYQAFVLNIGYPLPSHWFDKQIPKDQEDHPVVNVSWEDAQNYCHWLTSMYGHLFRLPTEEEWEKAARGAFPETRRYPWGDEWRAGRCNSVEANHGKTTPVYAYEDICQSPYGVVDLAGNVWEWTNSVYQYYPGSSSRSSAPGPQCAVRGGAWSIPGIYSRVSSRGHYLPKTAKPYLGFRIVQEID